MKKIFNILAIFLSPFLLGNCTLILDELEIPEEEKGVGRPYTEKTEYIEVTYQFNEGVKPIRETAMGYFSMVEADTILYFLDNVPCELIPETGGYVQIGMNEHFPLGYNGKVLSRTETSGMIRLVTTHATPNEIFKDLDFVADGPLPINIPEDYDPDAWDYEDDEDDEDDDEEISIYDDLIEYTDEDPEADYDDLDSAREGSPSSVKTRANAEEISEDSATSSYEQRKLDRKLKRFMERPNSTSKNSYIDYSLVKNQVPELYNKQVQKHFPKKYARMMAQGKTRSGDDEPIEDKIETETWALQFDLGGDLFDFFKFDEKVKDFKDIQLMSTIKKESSKQKFNKSIKDRLARFFRNNFRANALKWGLDANLSLNMASSITKTFHSEYSKKNDYQKSTTQTDNNFDVQLAASLDGNFTVGSVSLDKVGKMVKDTRGAKKKGEKNEFTLVKLGYPIPVFVPLGLALRVSFELGFEIDACGQGSVNCHSNFYTLSGSETKGDKQTKISDSGKPDKSVSIDFAGYAKADVFFELTTALEICSTAGVGGTLKVEAGVKASVDTDNAIPGTNNEYASENNYLSAYAELNASVIAYISPFGIKLAGTSYPLLMKNPLPEAKQYLAPTFEDNQESIIGKVTDFNVAPHFGGYYEIANTGLYPWNDSFEPRLRIYHWNHVGLFRPKSNLKFFDDYPIVELKPTDGQTELMTGYAYNFSADLPVLEKGSYVAVPVMYNRSSGRYLFLVDGSRQLEVGRPRVSLDKVYGIEHRGIDAKEAKKYKVSQKYNLYDYAILLNLQNGTKIKSIDFDTQITTPLGKKIMSKHSVYEQHYATGKYLFHFSVLNDFERNYGDWSIVTAKIGYTDYENRHYTVKIPATTMLMMNGSYNPVSFKGNVIDAALK